MLRLRSWWSQLLAVWRGNVRCCQEIEYVVYPQSDPKSPVSESLLWDTCREVEAKEARLQRSSILEVTYTSDC